MGVKLMDLRNGEKLQAIAPLVSQAEEDKAQASEPVAPRVLHRSTRARRLNGDRCSFTVIFYGLEIFRCKIAQSHVTGRKC
jgi:hypothetical protein